MRREEADVRVTIDLERDGDAVRAYAREEDSDIEEQSWAGEEERDPYDTAARNALAKLMARLKFARE